MNSTKGAVASTATNAPVAPLSKEAEADQNQAAPAPVPAPAAAEGDSEAEHGGGPDEADGEVVKRETEDQAMEDEDGASAATSTVPPATVFRIRLKQPPSDLRHKMSVPELCRNFSAVAWCGSLNVIACASETCARIPSSNANPPFWIPIHIVNPERPTECAVFNVVAGNMRLQECSNCYRNFAFIL